MSRLIYVFKAMPFKISKKTKTKQNKKVIIVLKFAQLLYMCDQNISKRIYVRHLKYTKLNLKLLKLNGNKMIALQSVALAWPLIQTLE